MSKKGLFKSAIALALALCLILFLLPISEHNVSAATSSSTAGTVSISSGSLNVRSTASASGSILTTLSKDSYVTLISKSGSWWKVEYSSGKYGYCSAAYISQVSSSVAANVSTSGGTLNVRTGPSTSYAVKSRLANGKTVIKLSQHGSFTKILYNGVSVGYVSSSYLSAYTTAESSAVSLKVSDYKQTDSRWSGVTLGSSGKTIKNIGCTTTALAMVESYRTGTTITPSAMSKKLTYSSSGSLYWPSNYTFVTDSNNYLYTIYGLLKQGKPVILGCKKSNGSQHWVVVTGFKGGTVSTSGFTINDPGSSSRTTLSQFLNVYPNFYKIAYYVQ